MKDFERAEFSLTSSGREMRSRYAESTVLQTLDDLALGIEGRIWLVHRAIP